MARPRLSLFHMAVLKKMKTPSMLEFNRILDRLSHQDSIGHLFVVDIKLHNRNYLMRYTLLFFKRTRRFVHMSALLFSWWASWTKTSKVIFKTHSTLDEKKCIPLYSEHLHFLIKRAGWLVTSIYKHFTFEPSKFKEDFVIMYQRARQKATSP